MFNDCGFFRPPVNPLNPSVALLASSMCAMDVFLGVEKMGGFHTIFCWEKIWDLILEPPKTTRFLMDGNGETTSFWYQFLMDGNGDFQPFPK